MEPFESGRKFLFFCRYSYSVSKNDDAKEAPATIGNLILIEKLLYCTNNYFIDYVY